MKKTVKNICVFICSLCVAFGICRVVLLKDTGKEEKPDIEKIQIIKTSAREGLTAVSYIVRNQEGADELKKFGRVGDLYIHADAIDISALDIDNLEVLSLNLYNCDGLDLGRFNTSRTISLSLTDTSLSDIGDIANMQSLERLNIREGELENPGFIKDVKNLQSFSITKCKIGDLSDFAIPEKLTNLQMQDCGLCDISFVAGMKNLKEINFSGNEIKDISALKDLKNLEWLILSENEIEDISAVAGLKNLKQLNVSKNNIEDVSAVAKLYNLYTLSASENEIGDISPVNNLKGLGNLHLENCGLAGVVDLSGAEGLEFIELGFNMIEDVILADSGKVMNIDLSYNNITDLSEAIYKTTYGENETPVSVNVFANNITNTPDELDGWGVNFWNEGSEQFTYEENKAYCEKVDELVLKYINLNEDELHRAIGAYIAVMDTAEYDYESLSSMEKRPHTEFNALVKGKAVCDGYSYAYRDILRKAGIKAYICFGDRYSTEDDTTHAWNIVRIDGKFYHCDATHDDGYIYEYTRFNNFGKSDEAYIQMSYTLSESKMPKCDESVEIDLVNEITKKIIKEKKI